MWKDWLLLALMEFLWDTNEVLSASAPAAAARLDPVTEAADAVTAPVLVAVAVCDTLALFDWSAEM
jgi:hypothetical protein